MDFCQDSLGKHGLHSVRHIVTLLGAALLVSACSSGGGSDSPADNQIDETAPSVVSVDTSASADVGGFIAVTFSEPIASGACVSSSVSLTLGTESINGSVHCEGSKLVVQPTTPLLPESDYQLTIATAIADQVGNHLVQSYQHVFRTRDREWTAPARISDSALDGVWSPEIVMAEDGEALVVWGQRMGQSSHTMVRRFKPTIGWQPASPLGADMQTPAVDHQVAINANGDFVIAWQQSGSDDTPSSIWATVGNIYAELPAPRQLNSSEAAWSPMPAIDHEGNAVVLWGEGNPQGLMQASYQHNAEWGIPFSPFDAQYFGNLASDSKGGIAFIYSNQDVVSHVDHLSITESLIVRHLSIADGWSEPTAIASQSYERPDPLICNQLICSPGYFGSQLSFGESGYLVATWSEVTADFSEWFRAKTFVPMTTWSSTHSLNQMGQPYSSLYFTVVDDAEHAYVVWAERSPFQSGDFQHHFSLVSAASIPEPLQAPPMIPGLHGSLVDMASNGDGRTMLLWRDDNGVHAAHHVTGDEWSDAVLVDEFGYTNGGSLKFDGNGNAVAVWLRLVAGGDELKYEVWAARYQ